MICIDKKQDCCGCEACVQSCPKQCITMQTDEEGFSYPKVALHKCIDCKICEKVCPERNIISPQTPLQVFAAQANNQDIIKKSSSGGIFSLLASKVLEQGGVVFGAIFDEQWNVKHSFIESSDDLDLLRRSKYVQSKIGNTFKQVKFFLENDRKVLFSGTPCQVKGLKLFLSKDYENLVTVDFACHGVPSPTIWKLYLEAICKENNITEEELFQINFRDKSRGWRNPSISIKSAKGDITNLFSCDPYMRVFLSNIILRPSCYECSSKNGQSMSDITLADFWGIEQIFPECTEDLGYSLVLLNTTKGKILMPNLSNDIKETTYSKVLPLNAGLNSHIIIPEKRAIFFKSLKKTKADDILYLINKTLSPSIYSRLKKKLLKILK